MEPYIKDGSLVFLDKSQVNINIAGVFAINTTDGLYIKKIKTKGIQYYMCSSNEDYEDVKLDEFEVIELVKGVYTNL